ncbi:hypothetical protein TURU_077931 [Turdus rufiventris]|nr:hypothetical protein TURU_077931 [Turdus rufiventris]
MMKEYLSPAGPSQYTTFTAMINADEHRETVSSVANKLRNFDSMMNGLMQAHISAMVKDLKEEVREMRGMRGHVGAEPDSIAGVMGGSQELTLLEAEVSLTGKGWQKHTIVTGPEAPCILGIDFLKNGYYKDPKGFRWAFGIAAVAAEGIKQLNTLRGLSENPSALQVLKVEDQQVPIATSTVHHRQYWTNRDVVIPIHNMIHELESQGVVSKTHSPFNRPIWPMPECRPQFAFTWRGVQYIWNRLPQGWKHSPTICNGLIQAALEKGEAPEYLQYIDELIVWGNTAMEVFEKGEKIIQILLRSGFAIKKSTVKGPA